ncbi:MAG: hypothetical protein K0S45_3977 [Nitrospira sp.]|jgi:hypothetical protein|nr:hypothetical protein [Nitrospira sp.]
MPATSRVTGDVTFREIENMAANLLRQTWTNLDSHELRLLLDKRIGGPGQYDGISDNKFYLPLAGSSCRIGLMFCHKKIVAIEPGPAFDASEWDRICQEIERSILAGSLKVGREYSFSSFRVLGSWRGDRSGVQILPAPDDAPRAPVEMADHPFILELSIQASDFRPVTDHRRMREHRNLTFLLNVLLAGRTSLQPRRSEHLWALVPRNDDRPEINEIKWVQQFFFAKLGKVVIDVLSPPASQKLDEMEPEEYYGQVGHDGKGLRIPADLDQSICHYLQLSPKNRAKFDRATFWLDMASRQWTISISSSFASLVSAVESLTDRGTTHRVYCEECKGDCQHEVPGVTERFRAFIEKYAPGAALTKRRNEMYSLRSGILHGSDLMQLDQDLAFGWDPPWWNEREIHSELSALTRVAMRNWLKNPSAI